MFVSTAASALSRSERIETIKLRDKIRLGKPISFPISVILTSLTPVVRLGMWYRLQRPRTRVNAHVISFGNITAGGTGKTPAVIDRAMLEIATGKKVAVLTRGYGSQGGENLIVARGSESPDGLYNRIGDEPALIARKVPEAIIIKCADRVLAAQTAIEKYGCDTLIMDDGFQHVQLERDENIVLIDATNPFGNGYLLPRGILREPLTALRRATNIVLTRCDQAHELDQLESGLKEMCTHAPIRKTCHMPNSLWRVCDNSVLSLEEIHGKEISAVCAIGNPESFFDTLENLGAKVTNKIAFPDHYHITSDEIPSADIVVTTEKDAIRMQDSGENVLALGIELQEM